MRIECPIMLTGVLIIEWGSEEDLTFSSIIPMVMLNDDKYDKYDIYT